MKFISALTFIAMAATPITATWCKGSSGTDRCSKEDLKGQATLACCDKVGIKNHDRGCWLTEDVRDPFLQCCINDWGCVDMMD